MMIAAQLGLALVVGAPPRVDVLEPDNRRLRGNQVAVDAFGGSMVGRAPGQSFIVGGRVTYFPIRQLGIGAAYGWSRGIGGLDTVRARSIHYVHGQLEVPLVSALRVGRRKVIEADLFGEVGAGAVHIAATWQAMGAIGGGVRLYPAVRWLAIRIDALTFLHETPRAGGTAFDTDVTFTLGLSMLLPTRSASPPHR
jgi:hypothetical protein